MAASTQLLDLSRTSRLEEGIEVRRPPTEGQRSALERVAVTALLEGCFGATIDSAEACEAAALTEEAPLKVELLGRADEADARATLAWRELASAIRAGGAHVAAVVAATLVEARVKSENVEFAPEFARAGLDHSARVVLRARLVANVLEPAARTLLAAAGHRDELAA